MTIPTSPNSEDKKAAERIGYAIKTPPLSFEDAVNFTKRAAKEVGERGPMTGLAKVMDYSPNSSNFRFKAGAIRKLSLITFDGPQNYALTDIGRRIHRPASNDDEVIAVQESFFSHPILKGIWEYYSGKTLPEPEYVKNIIVSDLKIPNEIKDDWYDYFIASALFAALIERLPSGYYRWLPKHTAHTQVQQQSNLIPEKEEKQAERQSAPDAPGFRIQRIISGGRTWTLEIPASLDQPDIDAIRSILKLAEPLLDGLKSVTPAE